MLNSILAFALLGVFVYFSIKASAKKKERGRGKRHEGFLSDILPKRTDEAPGEPGKGQEQDLSADRLKHSAGVARRCYEIGREKGLDEESCHRLFVLGYVHDIGYAFSDGRGHAGKGSEMLDSLSFPLSEEVLLHGQPIPLKKQSEELQILNRADLETLPDGTRCSAAGRLAELETRFGKESAEYRDMHELARLLTLLPDTAKEAESTTHE